MTPKEKAQKLIAKFNNKLIADAYVIYQNVDESKRCALIAVDEILNMGIMAQSGEWNMAKDYWQEVKQEIEKL
jgi:hypothetical protein